MCLLGKFVLLLVSVFLVLYAASDLSTAAFVENQEAPLFLCCVSLAGFTLINAVSSLSTRFRYNRSRLLCKRSSYDMPIFAAVPCIGDILEELHRLLVIHSKQKSQATVRNFSGLAASIEDKTKNLIKSMSPGCLLWSQSCLQKGVHVSPLSFEKQKALVSYLQPSDLYCVLRC